MLLFENRSFHQDRPEIFHFEYLNIAPQACAARKMFQDVDCFYYRIIRHWKWTCFLTSPPIARSAENFEDAEQISYYVTIISYF